MYMHHISLNYAAQSTSNDYSFLVFSPPFLRRDAAVSIFYSDGDPDVRVREDERSFSHYCGCTFTCALQKFVCFLHLRIRYYYHNQSKLLPVLSVIACFRG